MGNWRFSPILEQHLGDGSIVLVALLALLLLAAWIVSVLFTRISRSRQIILAVLRALVVLALIGLMLRPERIYTELQKQTATLVLLIDRSRSMSMADTISGRARWDVLREAFGDAASSLEDLADVLEIRAYVFDSDPQPVNVEYGQLALDARPVGDQSAYGAAMQEVLRREDGKRLVGMLLAGDGAQQTSAARDVMPQTPARQLSQLGCPIYAVTFGRSGGQQSRDVLIESMPDDLIVFVKNRLTVTGTLRISGYVNRDIPVQLVVETPDGKQQVVATENYRAVQDADQVRYELSYIPQQAGEFLIKVRAVAQEGEITTTNNELPTYLTVLAGGLRVLYLQGELRREQTFLRRALAASPDIDVTLLTAHTRDRSRWPVTNWGRYFEPGAFDVYILGDVDSKAFHPGDQATGRLSDLAKLRETVGRGAGLLVLGGWHSYRPGGFQSTPLAGVMPVEMDAQTDRFVRQNFGEPLDLDLHVDGPLQMMPAEPWGVRHYLMRLAGEPARNRQMWQQLPPLDGANDFRGVKDGAVVLAEDAQKRPLLVAGEPGGRVLAFAGDSTWRWVMHGQSDAHRRFWRQAILWLARKDNQVEGNVWIKMDGRRFTPKQRVTFSAGARNDNGDPLPSARLDAFVTHPDGTRRPVRMVRQGDGWTGSMLDCELPGSYDLQIVAKDGGETIGEESTRFLVYQQDRELSNAAADPAMMENLAQQTKQQGGRRVAPSELPALFQELAESPKELDEKVSLTVTYWDRWYVFLLITGLLSAEWFLRKKWKLV